MKNFDIKTIFIIILGIAVIVVYFVRGGGSSKYDEQINELQRANTTLLLKNDSLKKSNIKLDKQFDSLEVKVKEDKEKLVKNELEINKLNEKKSRLPKYVNSLSANDVALAFTKYLEQYP